MTAQVLNTFGGRRLDLNNPQPEQIALEDIAAALSKLCRFGAQAQVFYSVAQHAILVAELVREQGRPDLTLAALHHDSHEAYLGDMPTPVKRRLGFRDRPSPWHDLCDSVDGAIEAQFGFGRLAGRDAEVVKLADRRALAAEAAALLADEGAGVRQALAAEGCQLDRLYGLPKIARALEPEEARIEFVRAHDRALAQQP